MPEIAIWPGSSSFAQVSSSYYVTGSGNRPTSFGYYDADPEFIVEADKVADWCARRLGYPMVDVELVDISFFTAFEEAITQFTTTVNRSNVRDHMQTLIGSSTSNELSHRVVRPNLSRLVEIAESYGGEAGAGGTVEYKKGWVNLMPGSSSYDLAEWANVSESGERIEIKRIYHDAAPAISRYFDPYIGVGGTSQHMLDGFGWGGYSPASSFLVMPMYADLLRLQAIELNDQIRKSAYAFKMTNNKVTISPIPQGEGRMFFDYIVKSDRVDPLSTPTGSVSDLSNVPYSRVQFSSINDIGVDWIYRYTLAIAKEMLGTMIRAKYASLPIPQGEVTLNGIELGNQGREDKMALIEELKELLQQLSRQGQAEQEQIINEALTNQLRSIPLYIYIK